MAMFDMMELIDQFQDGCGYGDPEARRNAEMRVQLLLAEQQLKSARRLNTLSLLMVVVGLLQVVVQGIQLWIR